MNDWTPWFGSYSVSELVGAGLIGASALMPIVAMRVGYRFGLGFVGAFVRTLLRLH